MPLAVKAGDVPNLEIRLLAATAHAIHGMVLKPDGSPAPNLPLTLADPGPGRDPPYQTTSQPDGTFVFPRVAPGDWRLSAIPAGHVVEPRVFDWVEMRNADIEGVKLRLAMPFTVKGRIVFETPPGGQAPAAPEVLLLKRHKGQLILSGETILSGGPAPDGHFEIETVDQGMFQILPGPPPPLYYLEAVRLGETTVSDDVELSPGAPEIILVYRTGGGTIRGSVEKCDSGQVLLFAEDRSVRQVPRGACDTNGRFEISAIRPGAYKALAFPEYLLVNEEAAAPFLRTAVQVTVRAGEVTEADLTLSGVR